MRSAWSPTRSMSLEMVFELSPNCLLALPTVLATDLTSRSGRPAFLSARGTGTPRTFLGRVRLLSASPPAIPATPAPTATAGPRTLLAALFTVPTRPVSVWLVRWLVAGERRAELDLLRVWGRLAALPLPLDRAEPFAERRALLRLRAEADCRWEALPPDRDALLGFAFEPDPFDEPLLLCPEREADLVLAIPHPFLRDPALPAFGVPTTRTANPGRTNLHETAHESSSSG